MEFRVDDKSGPSRTYAYCMGESRERSEDPHPGPLAMFRPDTRGEGMEARCARGVDVVGMALGSSYSAVTSRSSEIPFSSRLGYNGPVCRLGRWTWSSKLWHLDGNSVRLPIRWAQGLEAENDIAVRT